MNFPHKKSLHCYLFGHKIGELNDGGYRVCERCGCHEYYDRNQFNNAARLMRPIWKLESLYYRVKFAINDWYRRVILKDDLPF